MIPHRVRFAVLLALFCHGFFILTQRYRLSYDSYTHMLFADHYAKDWFSLWSTRWYAGFEVVSYPPLIHQLIAIFIPVIGFSAAYGLILWLVTTLFPLGIYAFSRIFAGKIASSHAAIASAVLLPIYVTGHIFGQLPFLAATLFALFGAAALARFLREGGLHNFIFAVSITATTMVAHHATLMVQPFLFFALGIYQLNKDNWKKTLSRFAIFLVFAIPACMIVIWPFWQWGMHQQLQVPIDHLSRHNFFTDSLAAAIFFWPVYFPIGAVIPFLFYRWPIKFAGLQFTFIVLFILGLGGTTPLPNLLFGKSWEWLTYDRFAFWASVVLTPFFGILLIRFRKWMKRRLALRGIFVSAPIFFIFTCAAIGSWFTPILLTTQPGPIDMSPIVNFLNEADHSYWRYLTFGFGDQFAYLNLLTTATTIDGSYHTARTLPELRESGIGQIDTAYWALKGIPAIGPILKVSGKYGVRWGFVNRREYIPELKKDGWVFVKFLSNGIQVWENPKFIFKPPVVPPDDPFKSFSWGIFPFLSLITTLAFGAVNIWPVYGEKIIRKTYTGIIGLLPLSLGFWYYKTIFEFSHEHIYFTYDHALFFLSDGLAVIAIVLWLAVQAFKKTALNFSLLLKLLFALCAWMTLSAFWSIAWQTSLYIAIHFWLIVLLVVSMGDFRDEAWNGGLLGLCIAGLIQACIGVVEFSTQSTQLLAPLNMQWPGLINASTQGVSILKFANGENFLRVYGTFPHPNILAGFTLMCIAAAIACFFQTKKINWIALMALAAAISLLAVTFSRSAWLGLIAFFLVIILKSKSFEPKKIGLIISIVVVTFLCTLIPLRELVLSRTVPTTGLEESSLTGRVWFAQQALKYIEERPLTGIGPGSFIIQLAERSDTSNSFEPVHNIPLLVFCETGAVGFILLMAIFVTVTRDLLITKKSGAIVIGALLAGIGVIALFDHYFWSLAPGRMMLGFILGLWHGQIAKDDSYSG